MIVENACYRLKTKKRGNWLNIVSALFARELGANTYPLRFSIVDVSDGEIVVESTIVRFTSNHKYADKLGMIEVLTPRRKALPMPAFWCRSDCSNWDQV